MKFFLGTTNEYKVREIASILRPLGIPLSVTAPIDPDETGDTLQANARIKAEAYSAHIAKTLVTACVEATDCHEQDARTHLRLMRNWTICEDSGISVPYLAGLPGPWSARFDDCLVVNGRVVGHRDSGRGRAQLDEVNNTRVLEMMRGVPQPYRVATFGICLMVADIDGKVIFESSNEVAGWITEEARGQYGFGYDAIFASGTSFGKTWAELDTMRKNIISHRRRALQEFTAWLGARLKDKTLPVKP